MTARYALAETAALVGEPTRAAMLLAVLDGRALPAGELARVAGLSASATSLHLAKLTQGGLLAVRQEGRHRYYRLASAEVAHALEALSVIATAPPPERSPLPGRAALRAARSCYDHLAGALSIALVGLLERERVLRAAGGRTYEITSEGAGWLADTLHIEIASLERGRRPIARQCLDLTERRPHVAGALGAALLERFVEGRWVAREADSRALRVTTRGRAAFAKLGLVA